MLWCLHAALTIAAAMPALMARGYSFAWKVVQLPSAFFHVRHPVGVLGLSTVLNYSVNSLSIFTVINLVGFLVAPPNLQCWR